MSSSKKAWRAVSWPILAIGLTAPWITNCGSVPGGMPNVPGAGGACPDTSSVEAIEKFDYVGGFKLDVETAGKLKAGLAAATELKGFADSIDSDLKTGCGGLASDLGERGTFASGNDACKAAIKALGDVKAKMGANVSIKLDIKAPECRASMDAYADCAGHCDATVKPGEAKVECEPGKLSGSCGGSCSGSCDMNASAKCTERCSGSCDATMKGSCGGNCDGKCDGKTSKGAACSGTCEGKCDAHIEGTCSGSCTGGCSMKASATCNGTCNGSCSVQMQAPKCTGEITPPKMSADCKAHCDAKVQAKAECTPAEIGVKVEGSADATASVTYKKALEKNLPLILKIAMGVGERGMKMAGNVQASVDGLQASVKGSTSGGPVMAAKLAGCVAAPFKAAVDGAASLKANVSVSVDVKASASGSAHAG
jgi:hypothetical protein